MIRQYMLEEMPVGALRVPHFSKVTFSLQPPQEVQPRGHLHQTRVVHHHYEEYVH